MDDVGAHIIQEALVVGDDQQCLPPALEVAVLKNVERSGKQRDAGASREEEGWLTRRRRAGWQGGGGRTGRKRAGWQS